MTWKRTETKGKYLKFEAGKSFEGIYNGYDERDNPFFDPKKSDSPTKIIDYKLTVDGEDKVLSSTANTLKDQLMTLTAPCEVKIECVQKGIRKWFVVWTQAE